MSRIFVHGCGAVSPAGWGVVPLSKALVRGEPLPVQPIERPRYAAPLFVRRAPAPDCRPEFLAHARLRRASPIAQFAVGAAIEAIGADAARIQSGSRRLGIIYCAFAGCVGYTRRFYDETLRDPLMASPLIFPETVFNAPSSHLSAYFGASDRNYTLVGDQGEFLCGLALAADWLGSGCVDGCLVVAAEETDWLTADALRLFAPGRVAAEGAGAVYLRCESGPCELLGVTEPQLYLRTSKCAVASKFQDWLASSDPTDADLLCDGMFSAAAVEGDLRGDLPGKRLSPERVLGDGLGTGGAWQVVAAVNALKNGDAQRVFIRVIGANKQAVGAVVGVAK